MEIKAPYYSSTAVRGLDVVFGIVNPAPYLISYVKWTISRDWRHGCLPIENLTELRRKIVMF